ncbi:MULTISPECIES: P1 family peptidase [unclassified Brevundimonas]|uniref:P1 family peptidase n=1 Tax=unclassified Brevundimonas TaxID=2622653 RepID=UPI0025B85659|nr:MULTISPECIES: P1 family peptidase [unclassified Brevundimonas]
MNRRTVLSGAIIGAAAAATGAAAQETRVTKPKGQTGPRNLITDVAGLKIGQAHDAKARTGVTVILAETPAVAAVDVRGGGPAGRETDVLKAENLVQEVDAIVLSGGSVYGLAAADGIAAWMGMRGRGYGMGGGAGVPPSPIVPAACLYDLANGGDKQWGMDPPYRRLAVEALEGAGDTFALGTAGAGYGAQAGGLKGGIGSASSVTSDGWTVGAIAAVNSVGSVIAPDSRQFWAAPFEIGNEFGGLGSADLSAAHEDWGSAKFNPRPRENTTLAVVATDVALSRVECQRLAIMAQDGLSRAIRPAHAPFDGDTVFVLSTGKIKIDDPAQRNIAVSRLGNIAADTLARAIARGVFEATAYDGTTAGTWKSTD